MVGASTCNLDFRWGGVPWVPFPVCSFVEPFVIGGCSKLLFQSNVFIAHGRVMPRLFGCHLRLGYEHCGCAFSSFPGYPHVNAFWSARHIQSMADIWMYRITGVPLSSPLLTLVPTTESTGQPSCSYECVMGRSVSNSY